MAYERDTHQPDARRRAGAPDSSSSDPIGRLDEVLVTLEQMLEDRGVAPTPVGREGGSAAVSRDDPEEQESLPLLEDVVTPAVEAGPERSAGEPEPGVALTDPPPANEPLSLGFEIVPEENLPRVDELELDPPTLDPPALEPQGERYGDAPPPSLDPEVYRHLIDRLANEIDVIVQTGTEEAMHRAAVDIAARVRDHVAIILPEVIEELIRMSNRPSD